MSRFFYFFLFFIFLIFFLILILVFRCRAGLHRRIWISIQHQRVSAILKQRVDALKAIEHGCLVQRRLELDEVLFVDVGAHATHERIVAEQELDYLIVAVFSGSV